jgi:2-phospho-L-lactate guanylyltransferase
VRAVVVVTDDDEAAASARRAGAVVVADEPAAGLNAALRHGESVARTLVPSVGALSADLAALRHRELTAALSAAPRGGQSFIADAAGAGTTLLLAPTGIDLDARFGERSAAAHRASGAAQLDASAWPSLRRDVDTEADVRAAVLLGIGPHTARVLAEIGPEPNGGR